MTEHDKKLLEKVLENKERYKIFIDNDDVYVIDTKLSEEDEHYTDSFDKFGYDLLHDVFNYFGLNADYV